MSPVTHFLLSWTLAERSADTRRERAWITFAGVAPDLDGLGWVALSAFLIVVCLVRTVRTGISPASLFSRRIDAIAVATLRRRWAQWSGTAEQ
jgi:hypothetical protein